MSQLYHSKAEIKEKIKLLEEKEVCLEMNTADSWCVSISNSGDSSEHWAWRGAHLPSVTDIVRSSAPTFSGGVERSG